MNEQSKEIERFLSLAKKGKNRGSSGGEKRCYKLAKLLNDVIEHAPGTDDTAIKGFCLLTIKSLDNYHEVKDLIF